MEASNTPNETKYGYWIEKTLRIETRRQLATEPINIQPGLQAAMQHAQILSRNVFLGGPTANDEVATVFRVPLDSDGDWPINITSLPYSVGIQHAPVNGGVTAEAVAAYSAGLCVAGF